MSTLFAKFLTNQPQTRANNDSGKYRANDTILQNGVQAHFYLLNYMISVYTKSLYLYSIHHKIINFKHYFTLFHLYRNSAKVLNLLESDHTVELIEQLITLVANDKDIRVACQFLNDLKKLLCAR